MTDHIDKVRKRAQDEAAEEYPWTGRVIPNITQQDRRIGYISGQVALASRLTREKIAEAIYAHSEVDDTSMYCLCGFHADGDLAGHQADAVLALLKGEE